MKTKVLIVYSINDLITQNRIEHLNSSPQTEDYEIFYTFARRELDFESSLKELIFRIRLPIKSYNPDYVIFHAGAAFHQQPKDFQQVVITLKKEYKDIKFSYEPIETTTCKLFFDSLSEFGKSKETAKIVYLLFFKIINRKISHELWIQQLL